MSAVSLGGLCYCLVGVSQSVGDLVLSVGDKQYEVLRWVCVMVGAVLEQTPGVWIGLSLRSIVLIAVLITFR